MKKTGILAGTAIAVAAASSSQTLQAKVLHDNTLITEECSSPQTLATQQDQKQGFLIDEIEAKKIDAKKFLKAPEHFLRKFGLDFNTAACPDQVHKALERGYKLSEKLFNILKKNGLNERTLGEFENVANEELGENFRLELIPYGLRFLEELYTPPNDSGTITGSGTVTFADTDADVDG